MMHGLKAEKRAAARIVTGPLPACPAGPPGDPQQLLRIRRFNASRAMFDCGRFDVAIKDTAELVSEYYRVLGITAAEVFGRSRHELEPLLGRRQDLRDDLRHLADCLALNATAIEAAGGMASFVRVHAMKFYDLADAIEPG